MRNLSNIKMLPLFAMLSMFVLSFANCMGFNISGFVIPVGVIFFFINKAIEKESDEKSGLDIKHLRSNLKDRRIWIWILLPLLINVINVSISKTFLPEYIEYETTRAGAFVSIELSVQSALLFLVFALGEEIAWRAFFQKQLGKVLHIVPVILFTSLLFTVGHFKSGDLSLVMYGMIFTFINSCLYAIVFYKTNNAWVSTLAHYLANMFEVLLYVML